MLCGNEGKSGEILWAMPKPWGQENLWGFKFQSHIPMSKKKKKKNGTSLYQVDIQMVTNLLKM